MKRILVSIGIFFSVTVVYVAVATQGTFHPKWALDYFNAMADALMHGRLDIVSPSVTYDLIEYQGKWFAPWGVLAAVCFMPFQLLKGRFIPPLYVGVAFAGLNVVLFHWLLMRIRREFLPAMREWGVYAVTLLYAFGTMNFYVGTLGSSWHVDQMVSSFFGTLSLCIIFRRRRTFAEYCWSVIALVPAFFGHATIILLFVVPLSLYLYDLRHIRSSRLLWRRLFLGALLFGIPMGVGSAGFFLYNYLRFGSIFEYGYRYIHEAPNLEQLRLMHGVMSLRHLPNNFWHFALNMPTVSWQHGLRLGIDLYGNSLFFLTPPFLAAFLAFPFGRTGNGWTVRPHIAALWLGTVIAFLPSLLLYSTGWMQFGYRYALDITPHLVLLSVFGIKGRVNVLYMIGVLLAILFHTIGISMLM